MGYPIGCEFIYRSKYGGIVVGIVKEYHKGNQSGLIDGYIISIKDVHYSLREIELQSLSYWRDKKLKELGL